MPQGLFSGSRSSLFRWWDYTVAASVAKNGTVIVCAVSQPYLPFLKNCLISIARQKHQEKVLVIAEDYATLYKVNGRWPGHAVLVLPAADAQTAHKFGSQDYRWPMPLVRALAQLFIPSLPNSEKPVVTMVLARIVPVYGSFVPISGAEDCGACFTTATWRKPLP